MSVKLTKSELKQLNERFGRKRASTKRYKYDIKCKIPSDKSAITDIIGREKFDAPKTLEDIFERIMRNIQAQNLLANWQKILLNEQEILLKQLKNLS